MLDGRLLILRTEKEGLRFGGLSCFGYQFQTASQHSRPRRRLVVIVPAPLRSLAFFQS